jgi:NADH dehydrogenase
VIRIVILGGGFAAIGVAQRLERLLRPGDAELTLISRENFSLFTPMLPEVSSGALGTRDIVTPIRAQVRRTHFILADVTGVDMEKREVSYAHTLTGVTERLGYDQLVMTTGASTSTFGLPGIAERVFALKTLEDAAILRNRFIWLLELADDAGELDRKKLLTLVVVGGGFTGVETTGEMAELFRNVEGFYPRVRSGDVRIVLIEGGATLLPGLPPRMGSYAEKFLRKRGVEVVTGDGVRGADDEGIELISGRRIETRTIVWSAGVKARVLAGTESLTRAKNGAILVNADLSVPGFPGMWACGDCAAVPSGSGTFYPPTAQHAIREAPLLAENLVAKMRGKAMRPFHYTSLGMMASLGARKAVAQLPGDRVLTGFLAWFLWRTYYLARLPGLDRKLRVAFDWTLELLFPRDISELRVYTRRAQSSAAADAGLLPRDENP